MLLCLHEQRINCLFSIYKAATPVITILTSMVIAPKRRESSGFCQERQRFSRGLRGAPSLLPGSWIARAGLGSLQMCKEETETRHLHRVLLGARPWAGCFSLRAPTPYHHPSLYSRGIAALVSQGNTRAQRKAATFRRAHCQQMAGRDCKPHPSGSKMHVISISRASQVSNPVFIPSSSLASGKLEKIHKG